MGRGTDVFACGGQPLNTPFLECLLSTLAYILNMRVVYTDEEKKTDAYSEVQPLSRLKATNFSVTVNDSVIATC